LRKKGSVFNIKKPRHDALGFALMMLLIILFLAKKTFLLLGALPPKIIPYEITE
jgi:hypothetical protein